MVLDNLSLSQVGLLMDAIGFVIIFFFGGFSFGINIVIMNREGWYVLPAKLIGALLVVGGFIMQFIGNANS